MESVLKLSRYANRARPVIVGIADEIRSALRGRIPVISGALLGAATSFEFEDGKRCPCSSACQYHSKCQPPKADWVQVFPIIPERESPFTQLPTNRLRAIEQGERVLRACPLMNGLLGEIVFARDWLRCRSELC